MGSLFLYHTYLVFRGEVPGDLRGYLACGQPFTGTVEGGDEPDALERLAVLVAHGGVEYFAFAVLKHHHHRFMALALGAPSGGEDFHVSAGATEGIIEFVLGVLPFGGHASGDGVVRLAYLDDELVLRAVAATTSGVGVAYELVALIVINIRSVFFGASAPATEADHFVILQPVGKRVVGRMHTNKSTTVTDVFFESCLHFLGPVLTVVVADHHIVFSKGGTPSGPLFDV